MYYPWPSVCKIIVDTYDEVYVNIEEGLLVVQQCHGLV